VDRYEVVKSIRASGEDRMLVAGGDEILTLRCILEGEERREAEAEEGRGCQG